MTPPAARKWWNRPITFKWMDPILVVVAVYGLFHLVTPPHDRERARRSACQSNLRQIGSALLLYASDHDGQFPVGARSNAGPYWGGTQDALLAPYIKNTLVYQCPSARAANQGTLTYMYNDLAAGKKRSFFSNAAHTVLAAEGENVLANVGHARGDRKAKPFVAQFNAGGGCDAGQGATVHQAVYRHQEGGTYLFADGRVRYLKPEAVFFPDQNSNRASHTGADKKATGPNPSHSMTFGGVTYKATFHIQ